MEPFDKDAQFLEYLYKEYIRLSDLCDSYVKSSFDDFKLLSAIGVILVWKPFAELINVSSFIVLLGFFAILFVIAILGTRDLLKKSFQNYYLSQVRHCEEELRRVLDQTNTPAFRVAANWENWKRQKHLPVTYRLYLIFIIAVTAVPSIALILQEPRWYAVIYAIVASFLLTVYLSAVRILYGRMKSLV